MKPYIGTAANLRKNMVWVVEGPAFVCSGASRFAEPSTSTGAPPVFGAWRQLHSQQAAFTLASVMT